MAFVSVLICLANATVHSSETDQWIEFAEVSSIPAEVTVEPGNYPLGESSGNTGSVSGWLSKKLLPEVSRLDQVRFGSAMDTDGERLIVGATGADDDHRNGGAAYIYRLSSGGEWEVEARLTSPVPSKAERLAFGAAVAIDGDLALVGAPWKGESNGPQYAYAHLYERIDADSGWVEVCRIGGVKPGGRFGEAVDLDGALAGIGDPGRAVSAPNSPYVPNAGSVVVVEYLGQGPEPCRSVWVDPPEPEEGMAFGESLDIDGGALVVGAPGKTRYSASGSEYPASGEVYIFQHDSGQWEHKTTVGHHPWYRDRRFGSSVALAGDSLLVGAPYQGHFATGVQRGEVYLFRKDEGGPGEWGFVRDFVTDSVPAHSHFGSSLAMEDSTIVIGAPGFDPTGTGMQEETGRVMILRRNPISYASWTMDAFMTPGSSAAGDRFSSEVALGGDKVFIGSPLSDRPTRDSGEVFILTPTGLAYPRWEVGTVLRSTARASARQGKFGSSVDLDLDTLVIVQPGRSTVQVLERQTDSAVSWTYSDSIVLDFGEASEIRQTGMTAVVGEGVVVVGVPYDGVQAFASGVVYLVTEDDEGWGVGQRIELPDPEPFFRFGVDVAMSGSVLAVAAQGASNLPPYSGAVFLFEPHSGPGTPWVLASEVAAPAAIGSLPAPMSVDIDGETVVACDHTWGADSDSTGACDVFRRDEDTGRWSFVQRLTASDPSRWMTFGYDVAIDGDTMLIGAPFLADARRARQARAYVFERDLDGRWVETACIGRDESMALDHVGQFVALEGDVLALGAPAGGNPLTSGVALVFSRRGVYGNGWRRIAVLMDQAPEAGLGFGTSLATNGQEIVVGGPCDRDRGFEAGAVTVFARELVRSTGSRHGP